MKKQKKRQKGITLIALVITIIVLLILAGVSISLVVGNNGILGRAEDTVDIHQKAKVLEEAEMILSGWQTDYIVEKTPYEGKTENTPSGADVSCAGGKVTVTDNKTGTVYEASFSESAGLGEWKEVGTSEVTPTVPTNVKVTGVGLDKTNIILLINSTKQLTATIEPSNATNKEILWQSTNETVATVSNTGLVTANVEGNTKIIATTVDGNKIVECSVKVSEAQNLISQVSTNNYGDYVNYPVDLGIVKSGNALKDKKIPLTDWRIFYKDSTNTYLISADYLPVSKIPTGIVHNNDGKYNVYWSSVPTATTPIVAYKDKFLFNGFNGIATSNDNYKYATYLLNTDLWTSMVNTTYADAAIGTPTLEMLCASWNVKTPSEPLYFGVSSKGYTAGKSDNSLSEMLVSISDYTGYNDTLYFPHNNKWNSCEGYWLAAPCSKYEFALWEVYQLGLLDVRLGTEQIHSIRPVVCLKSTANAIKDEDGIWQLK